ncbi:MAG: hypothetical protein Q9183_007749, partial [Haloplaca sp. 2 TL-2023]
MAQLHHHQRYHHGISLYSALTLIIYTQTAEAMPYHLLSRPQQTKNGLFRQSPLAQNPYSHHLPKSPDLSAAELDDSPHITVPEPLVAAVQTSSRHIIPRVPPPRGRFSQNLGHRTPPPNPLYKSDSRPLLITFWALLLTLALLWGLYILYLRLRLGYFPSSFISLPWLEQKIKTQKRKKSGHSGIGRSTAEKALPSTSSFARLNRRKKAPPTELDLEALGLRQRRSSLPFVEAGRRCVGGMEDESSGTSSAYSTGAGARVLASMMPGDVSPAMATAGWSSGSSLAEKGACLMERGSQLVEKEW